MAMLTGSTNMNRSDASPLGAWSITLRIALVLAITVAYVLVFVPLYRVVDGSVVLLSFAPVVVGGWLLGPLGGLAAGVMVTLLNALLFTRVTGRAWVTVVQSGPALIFLLLILSIVVGGMAGWLSELLDRLKRQVQELAREREALKGEIDQRRQAEETLRQTEKLAAMGQLLAGVAHELNNLLSVIVGGTDLLRTMVGSGPLREEAEEIAQAGERCARIVRNLLALARQRPPEQQSVSLNQVVREAIELLNYALRADGIEVTLDLAPDLPLLLADPYQLSQVVVNLVTNSHHAMREASPPRRLILTTKVDSLHGRVTLQVADTGPGVPPEIQARIFEPFFTTKAVGEGTGLGLSLCRRIIEGQGGTIRLESPPGQGAIFRIELPTDARLAPEPEVRAAEAPPIKGKTILVVDDEPAILKLLTTLLSADGHQVETAPNGAVALEKLRDRTYDLILSDIKMPELDGPGLYREVERRHPGLRQRIVFITGDALGAQTKAFLAETGAPYLNKPLLLEEIRRLVERMAPAV